MEQVKTAAIVLAAGHGKRMHSKVAKQYLLLKGEPVVVHALRAFEKAEMDEIILVAGADEVEFCKRNIVEQYGFTSFPESLQVRQNMHIGEFRRKINVHSAFCFSSDFFMTVSLCSIKQTISVNTLSNFSEPIRTTWCPRMQNFVVPLPQTLLKKNQKQQ